MTNFIKERYRLSVLNHPRLSLFLLLSVVAFFAAYIPDFKVDASADSLLLENDRDLQLARDLSARYGTRDFLVVTFSPNEDLLSDHALQQLSSLRDDLKKLNLTDSVVTILDVPLINQSGSLSEIAKHYRTLVSEDVDKPKAREELLTSPLYSQLLINSAGDTTALLINLRDNPMPRVLALVRDKLSQKQQQGKITADELRQLQQIRNDYAALKDTINFEHHQNMQNIRAIMQQYESYGNLHLGGLSMIRDDTISFIKNDLVVFGAGVFVFLVLMLWVIFRQVRWVFLPLFVCSYASVIMFGLLGLVGWQVTVISSNFIALTLIITMSMNIHLIVRYRRLAQDSPGLNQRQLVLETASRMVWPCLYTALTTIVAFASLVVSGIKPVIDFGWMMTIGLSVTFLTTFLLFPAILVLLKKPIMIELKPRYLRSVHILSMSAERYGNKLLLLFGILLLVSAIGISRLEVEHSFIDNFNEDTEIYRGLKFIDDELGGTVTLDVVLKFEEPLEQSPEEVDEEFDFGMETDQADYWLTPHKIAEIAKIHDYLETVPHVGKVLSLASFIRVGETLNQGPFDAFELALIYKRMPETLKANAIAPYLSPEDNEARISLRIQDSAKDLRRNQLLKQIQYDLVHKLGFAEDRIRISGLLVLYNNVLQSLFKSQILSLGLVMLGISLMLLILFRSVFWAVIGVIPNIVAAAIILGLMGLLGIRLDLMTITVAGITIGIAVDNSIHYIYRFREEYAKRQDYLETLHYCYANTGVAIFYNAIVIIVGFSILVLSNFVPTAHFGILTACAMMIALLSALTLLPVLILRWRPLTT